MTVRRMAAIVNPRGGKQNGVRVLESVRRHFSDAGIQLDEYVTTHAQHATEIAKTLKSEELQGVCVVGGDGTIHEVADGLMQRSDDVQLPLGLIPAGTGNALAQHLGLTSPDDAALRIIRGEVKPMDVVEVTDPDRKYHCINIVGWGAVSDINRSAEQIRMFGTHRYTLAALWHIASPKVRKATLVLDGKSVTDDFLFVMACNTKFTGAGMKLAPHAEIGDGKIDVVVIRRTSRWQMLDLFRRVFDGSHVSLKCLEFHQVSSMEIHTEGKDEMNLDGEIKGLSPVTARVLPSALSIYV